MVVALRVALLGDLDKGVLGVLHHGGRDYIGRIGPHRGFVCLIPAYRAFARYSARASEYCVRVAGHLTFGLPVLRDLARWAADGNQPVAGSDKSHCRCGRD
jgi:hypothetical protein